MEVLLNLVWVAFALLAICAFLRNRRTGALTPRVSFSCAFLALACALALLFPVVSASDDLHPNQAVLEDATKRVAQFVAPAQHMQVEWGSGILPLLFSLCLGVVLVLLRKMGPMSQEARVIVRERIPRAGRAPPSL
jgi:hypothetical protein